MNEPQISLTGNLAFDPKLRYTPNGDAVVDLRVGTTQRRKVGDEWEDGETLWFDVACWRQLAEHVSASLHKGDRVTVTGRLAQSTFTREDGTEKVNLVIRATTVGLDLSRYPAKVLRPVKDGAAERAFGHEHAATAGEVGGAAGLTAGAAHEDEEQIAA